MPFAQVHYPFENREWFEEHFPGRLHRRVRRPDPGLVLHPARPGDRPVRPAAVPTLRRPRHRARRRRPQDVQAPAATTPSPTWSSPCAAPTPCAGSCCRRPSCGARTWSSTPRASTRRVRQVLNPIWNAWYFLVALRQRRRASRGRRPHRRDRRARPLHPGQDRRRWSTTVTARMDALRPLRRVRRRHAFLDALTNWYIRRSRDRFWGTVAEPPGRGRQGRRL